MLKTQQNNPRLCPALSIMDGVRVGHSILGSISLIFRRNQFPGEDPSSLDDPLGVKGFPDFLRTETLPHPLILQEGVDFLGLGPHEEFSLRRTQPTKNHLAVLHLPDQIGHGISLQHFLLTPRRRSHQVELNLHEAIRLAHGRVDVNELVLRVGVDVEVVHPRKVTLMLDTSSGFKPRFLSFL